MAFPLYFLEQIRERINIVDLISRSVRLQRRGAEWIGLCPFHPEKTPSFHVVPDKQFYHCFGCGAHGDALKFLREHHNLPFLEAVKELAEMAGLDMPARDPEQKKREDQREQKVNVMEQAAVWFHQQLMGSEGVEARRMLADRGIDQQMIAQFMIGYAPIDGGAMMRDLRLNDQSAQDLGLLKQGERGKYAFFRQRLMFPIKDVRGQTIAFGGRRMREDQPAKYMNSPDTPLFTKRQQLYNLDTAKLSARKGADLLIAEGYMDVIALVQAGFSAAVAPLGTALTNDQLRKLWQYSDSPILCLDGDRAGQKAALRVAFEAVQMMPSGKGLRFATLPMGEDPDSLIKSHGKAAMAQLIDQAVQLGAFLWQGLAEDVDFTQPESVSALKQRCDEISAGCEDTYLRASYRQFWRDQIWQSQRQAQYKKNQQRSTYPKARSQQKGAIAPRSQASQIRIRIVLAAMIRFPNLIEEFIESFHNIPVPEHLDKLYQRLHMYGTVGVQPTEDAMHALLDWLKPYHLDNALKHVLNREVYLVAPEVGPSGDEEQAREVLLRLSKLLYEQRLIEDGQRMYHEASTDPKAWDKLRLLQQEIQNLRQIDDKQ